jgi:hypothetical protein
LKTGGWNLREVAGFNGMVGVRRYRPQHKEAHFFINPQGTSGDAPPEVFSLKSPG